MSKKKERMTRDQLGGTHIFWWHLTFWWHWIIHFEYLLLIWSTWMNLWRAMSTWRNPSSEKPLRLSRHSKGHSVHTTATNNLSRSNYKYCHWPLMKVTWIPRGTPRELRPSGTWPKKLLVSILAGSTTHLLLEEQVGWGTWLAIIRCTWVTGRPRMLKMPV